MDSKGIPLEVSITRGNKHGARIAPKVINKLEQNNSKHKKYLLADKWYDSNKIREIIIEKKYEPIIPKRKYKTIVKKKSLNRKQIKIYKKRIIVENFFAWIKMNPKIDKIYEKTVKSYQGLLRLSCSMLVYKRL